MAKRKSNLDCFKKLLKYKALSEDLVVDIVYNLGRSDVLIEELDRDLDKKDKDKDKDNLANDDEIWNLLDA